MRLVLAVLLLLLPGCSGPGCAADERTALEALPLPPDAMGMERGAYEGDCQLTFQTPLSAPQVRDHYADGLAANGWRLTQTASDSEIEGEFGATLLVAERQPFSVTVDFEDLERYIEPRTGSHVALNLGRDR